MNILKCNIMYKFILDFFHCSSIQLFNYLVIVKILMCKMNFTMTTNNFFIFLFNKNTFIFVSIRKISQRKIILLSD